MPSLRLDDDHTIQAIGILADVLDRFSGVTSLECTLVSKALRQVQQTRSQIGMDFASRAFATLEPEVRRQIADDADDAAREANYNLKLPKLRAPRPAAVSSQSTGLLGALNNRGASKSRRPQ
jgi:hypothetical protein